jgi:hypothetical protein
MERAEIAHKSGENGARHSVCVCAGSGEAFDQRQRGRAGGCRRNCASLLSVGRVLRTRRP